METSASRRRTEIRAAERAAYEEKHMREFAALVASQMPALTARQQDVIAMIFRPVLRKIARDAMLVAENMQSKSA